MIGKGQVPNITKYVILYIIKLTFAVITSKRGLLNPLAMRQSYIPEKEEIKYKLKMVHD